MQQSRTQSCQKRIEDIHKFYMQIAIEEALKGKGWTSPNPIVGSVIVRDGKILSRGYHALAGQAHAEIEAMRHLPSLSDASSATLYVTLEPCSTDGQTPPCTQAIIDARIARVIYGATDPNPKHQGQAEKILEHAGIEVITGVLSKECEELNTYWNYRIRTQLPWVIAKCAMTLDGRISSLPTQRWITSKESRLDAMRLRASVEAILVGGGTIRDDDPALTVRGLTKKWKPCIQPWRVVWSRSGNIPSKAQVRIDEFQERTILVVGKSLPLTIRDLGARGISSVLIEGGGRTLGEAFDHDLVNEIRFYVAPCFLGGPIAAVGAIGLPGGRALNNLSYRLIGDDLVISALVER